MSALIFIVGLAIGISAFFYILSAISGIKKISKNGISKNKITKQNIETETIGFRGRKTVPPGVRICPLCGSELTKYEGLYASKINQNNENKIMIMGCKYCFKDS